MILSLSSSENLLKLKQKNKSIKDLKVIFKKRLSIFIQTICVQRRNAPQRGPRGLLDPFRRSISDQKSWQAVELTLNKAAFSNPFIKSDGCLPLTQYVFSFQRFLPFVTDCVCTDWQTVIMAWLSTRSERGTIGSFCLPAPVSHKNTV